jgi:predicted ATPase
VQRHDRIMNAAIRQHGGHVFKTVGDAFCAAFARPENAVAAALDAQRRLVAEDFSGVDGLRVRMALHSGTADEREGDYFGPPLNRIARIISIVHGGQVVLSDITSALVHDDLPPDVSLIDLGAHRLKDLAEPERLHQLVIADLPHEFPMLRSLEQLPNNLPLQLTHFIGRDDELATTKTFLKESRLVTLIGAGGIGKTRLALQVGADLLDVFDDGVWFVELAPVRGPEQVPSAVAGVLGVSESAEGTLTGSLVNFLRRKNLLLLLDNCEHVVNAAATLISAILRDCPEIRILATSRQPLEVTGEHPHRVSSLAVPPEKTTLSKEEALQYGAIALFADRARITTGAFELSDSNVHAVAQICRRLDGIALAIELAAPRLKMLTLEQLAQRLSERFRVLTGGSRDVLPRQQTMHALIDWSYDLLNEDEQRVFRRLCVFVSDFSLEAAAALSADETPDEWSSFELLSSLVDKSLVTSELVDSQRRYGLLESMRAYALERAIEFDEAATLRNRHAEYYTALAERAQTAYFSAPSTTAWQRGLESELEQFRAALDWTLGERANAGLGSRLLTALREFWPSSGLGATVCRWAEGALDEDVGRRLQAALWLTLGVARNTLSLARQQLEAFSRARQLYEILEDRAGLAQALRGEGLAQLRLGAFADADRTLKRALELFRELANQRGIATALAAIASGLMMGGRPAEARAAMLEVLELHRALGNEREMCATLLNIAETEFQLGDVESAVARAREFLRDDAVRADPAAIAIEQSNLAAYLFALDRLDEAHSEALGALRIARDIENYVHAAEALQHLAAIIAQADPGRAARLLGYVDGVLRGSGYTRAFTEQYTHDRLMATLRESLSEARIRALIHEGAGLTEDQAVELAQATSTNQQT